MFGPKKIRTGVYQSKSYSRFFRPGRTQRDRRRPACSTNEK